METILLLLCALGVFVFLIAGLAYTVMLSEDERSSALASSARLGALEKAVASETESLALQNQRYLELLPVLETARARPRGAPLMEDLDAARVELEAVAREYDELLHEAVNLVEMLDSAGTDLPPSDRPSIAGLTDLVARLKEDTRRLRAEKEKLQLRAQYSGSTPPGQATHVELLPRGARIWPDEKTIRLSEVLRRLHRRGPTVLWVHSDAAGTYKTLDLMLRMLGYTFVPEPLGSGQSLDKILDALADEG